MSSINYDNYIMLNHITDSYGNPRIYSLPLYPDTVQDGLVAKFSSIEILQRTAPIPVYIGSGPRTLTATFTLHRDMVSSNLDTFTDFNLNENYPNASKILGVSNFMDDYKAGALPAYESPVITPPSVTLRIGEQFYITGVADIFSMEFLKPLNAEGKYTVATFGISIREVEPREARSYLGL